MTTIDPLVHLVQDEEAKGQAKELFEAMKKSTGTVPKWMRVMANCDDILLGFFSMFKATMDNAPVDAKLKWKIAYKVSELNKCEYCVSVSKMKLKDFGFDNISVKDLESAADDREKAAFAYAEATAIHAFNVDPTVIQELKNHFTDEEIVEITAVVGLFTYINRFNDALGVLPDAT